METDVVSDPPLLRLGGPDGFELDAAVCELRRADGGVVELEPRPFRLLQYLVRHRDRLVSKDELLREVWDNLSVSDSALSTALKHVRRALGDRGADGEWIESKRGRGYRFVAEVSLPPAIDWMMEPEGARRDLHERSLDRVREGLDALGDLPSGATRDQLELEMHMALARTLAKARGWAAETVQAWEHASRLCTRSGDTRRAGIVRFGLAAGLLSLGRIEDALDRYDEVLRIGNDTNDHLLQVAGCIRGVPLMYLGRLRDAAASMEAGLALIRHDDDFMATGFSEDFSVSLRHWLSWTHWLLGDEQRSTEHALEAVEHGRRSDTFMLCYALVFTCVVALLRDSLDEAEALAAEAHTLVRKEQYALLDALSEMELATIRGLRGDAREAGEACDAFTAAIAAMGESGNRSGAGAILSFLARLQIRAERLDDAEGTIRLALAMSPETGPFFDAELLRLRAELATRRGQTTQAKEALDDALTVARAQGARAFERRIEGMRAGSSGQAS